MILHLGDLHPRRNLGVLIAVLSLLERRDDRLRDTSLVLVGADRGARATLEADAAKAGVRHAVQFVTDATDEEVAKLMRRADILAYPSLYEGFGLPVLEAMASGTPVVAARAAALPEVVGSAGLLVDPQNVREWHDALLHVLTSTGTAARLRDAGLQRAARFTWNQTARQTLIVYQECGRRSARGRRGSSTKNIMSIS
jgi:glycosyltransferase involved in cell wall biosynthesis